MTRGYSVSPLLAKEFRALLPIWAATLAALGAAYLWRHRSYSDIGLTGYIIGVVSLGAHSIGHDYGHRTLPMLLAQPVPRRRLFIAKFAIAGAMLATLAATAAVVFTADGFRGNDSWPFVFMPIVAAVFLTPLFTMLCRSTMAGAILGTSGPMTIWVLTMVIAWWVFGINGDAITATLLDRWIPMAAIACPILAALTWRAFTRLEAVDGTPLVLTLPRWLSARAGIRRHAPWRALLVKEIHQQQMTIAITLFYAVIWLIAVALRGAAPASVLPPLEAVLLLYCLGLTIVIGALASAEERQQGTLETQLLQPVSALRQWTVKCVVVLSLALAFGVVLPATLIAAFSDLGSLGLTPGLILLVIVLTSSSLYLSSLSSSGVKAMAWSLPASIGTAIFVQTMLATIAQTSRRLGTPLPVDQTEGIIAASQSLTVLLVPALLWFGYVNHMSAEHPWRRTVTQVGVLAALIVTSMIAGGLMM